MFTFAKLRTGLFVWMGLFALSVAAGCFSAKKHPGATKTPSSDSAGLTEAQKKVMLQHTLDEKLHYYYKDSANKNRQK